MTTNSQGQKILGLLRAKKRITTQDVVALLKVSRQYAKVLINNLITSGKLLKIGSTRSAFYVAPTYAKKHSALFPGRIKKSFRNINLEEHRILESVEQQLPLLFELPENVRSIFAYAFSEMLNNAIEHSKSKNIQVEVDIAGKKLSFRYE